MAKIHGSECAFSSYSFCSFIFILTHSDSRLALLSPILCSDSLAAHKRGFCSAEIYHKLSQAFPDLVLIWSGTCPGSPTFSQSIQEKPGESREKGGRNQPSVQNDVRKGMGTLWENEQCLMYAERK